MTINRSKVNDRLHANCIQQRLLPSDKITAHKELYVLKRARCSPCISSFSTQDIGMQLIKSTAHHVHTEPYQPRHDTRECRAARKRGAAAVIHSFCNTHTLFAIGSVLNGKEV